MANKLIARKPHWTQTKAGKAKLKKAHAKAWRTRQHNDVMKTDEEFPDDEPDYEAKKHRRSKENPQDTILRESEEEDMKMPKIPKLPKTRRSKASDDNTADSDEFLDEIMDRAEFQQAFPEVLASALGWDVIATDPKRKVIIISVQLE